MTLSSLRPSSSQITVRAGERRDIFEHLFAAIAEARRLDRNAGERAAKLVDHERRERFAFDVFGDDEQRLLHLNDFFEQRQDVGDCRDLAFGDEDERIVENGFHPLRVRDHVRRDVALVELHAVFGFDFGLERARLFDRDDAVFADFLHRSADEIADFLVVSGDRSDLRDLLLGVDVVLERFHFADGDFDRLLDAALDQQRVADRR